MKTFQAVCAKNSQKVNLVVQYQSMEEARSDLHKQGYSIIDIQEVQNLSSEGKVFYFEVLINQAKKSGQIQSSDIFKAYLKLVDDLHYTVVSIYEDQNATENEKILTTSKVHSSYEIYKKESGNKTQTKSEKQEATEKKNSNESAPTDSYVQKQLDSYYLIIDQIIGKIERLLTEYIQYLSPDRKNRLTELHIALKQLKNTTNLDKLRIISEASLLRIGEVEIELIQEHKNLKKQEFLKDTNDFLKKLGSSERVRNPEDDVVLKIRYIFRSFFEKIGKKSEEKTEKTGIDTQSFVFYKNLRELHIYKQKLHEVQLQIIRSFFSFDSVKKQRLELKKRLIIQNISLIENRIKNKSFSYTKLVKGIGYYTDVFLFFIGWIGDVFLYSLLVYSLFFILFHTGIFSVQINYNILFLIVFLSFFSFLTRFMKSFSLFVIGFIISGVFLVFLQTNF